MKRLNSTELEKNMDVEEEFADIGKKSGVEAEEELEHPFNAEKISISTMPVPLSRLIERLKEETILAPEIQRNPNLWGVEKKSRLIESLMLRIPLPMFYVAADTDENWKIVDGLQRISVIRQFMIDDKSFELKKLEFLKDFEGFKYDRLPSKYHNRIKDTQFQFAVIGATTPQEVQRNIFKRLNTGGLPLAPQEVRHALYYNRKTNDFLNELVGSEEFKIATTSSVDDSRMAAKELIIRFISFLIRDISAYPKNSDMDSFLSDTMQLMNAMPELNKKELDKYFFNRQVDYNCKIREFKEIKTRFKLAMNRATLLFDTHAFRKSTSLNLKYRAPINKSIFECVAVILSQISEERFNNLFDNRTSLLQYMNEQYSENGELYNAISRDSQKTSSVIYRFEWFNKTLVSKEYGGKNA